MDRFTVEEGKSKRSFYSVAPLLLVLVLLVSLGTAQRTTGALRGQVLDPQGASVANARITVSNEETGVVFNAVTSSAGAWNVPNLIPGKYSINAQAQGFRNLLRRDVVMLADRDNTADIQLPVGSASEVVEVRSDDVAVETSSSSLSNDFVFRRSAELARRRRGA